MVDRSKNGGTRSISKLIEYTMPIYFVVIALYASRTGSYSGVSTGELLLYLGSTLPLCVILILGTRIMVGANDYRFNLSFHFTVAGYSASLMGIFWKGTGIMSAANYRSLPTLLPSFINFVTVIGLLMVYFMAAVFSGLALTDNFTKEMTNIRDQVILGKLNTRVTSNEILNDSVYGPIGNLVNDILGTADELVAQLDQASELVSSTSNHIVSTSTEILSSSSEVTSTSQNMAHGASNQAELISGLLDDLDQMGENIDRVIEQISGNTQTVSQLSLQTNILALNAGIEASRAGDYGRGFAVVAENVRRLSEQSKGAAQNIEDVVTEISDTLRSTFNIIAENIQNVAAVSEETSASAEELAAASEQVNASIEELQQMAIDLDQYIQNSNDLLEQFHQSQ